MLSIAEMFAGSEGYVISLDELLPLNLLDLKEKVASLPVEIELPSAPLREEIIDLLLDRCLEEMKPVRVSGIIQVMEDGHGFLLQEIENYRLKSQSPFVPAPLIKKYGLKTGQCVEGFLRSKMDGATCPLLIKWKKLWEEILKSQSGYSLYGISSLLSFGTIFLETDEKAEWDNVSMRVVDLVSLSVLVKEV